MIEKKAKMKKRMGGIKGKIMVIIGGTVAITFLIIGILVYKFSDSAFTKNQITILQNSDSYVQSEVEKYFIRYMTLVEQMATDQNVVNIISTLDKGDKPTNNEYYKSVIKMLIASRDLDPNSIVSTYIGDINANIAMDWEGWISDKDYDVTTREWYNAAKINGTYISEPYEDSTTGNQVITISTPVYDANKKIIGITAADIEITTLNNMVMEQKLGETGYYIMASKGNIVLAHNDESKLLSTIDNIGLSNEILNSINNINISKVQYNNDGKKAYGGYLPIEDTGWKLISYIPLNEFHRNANQVTAILVTIFLVGITLTIISILIIAEIITRPLKKLTNVTQDIADGKLDVQIDVNTNDEVGLLANSLNALTARLKEYIAYINEITQALDNISNGELKIELVQSYDGDFSKIKYSLLQLSDILKKIIGEIAIAADEVSSSSTQVAQGSQTLAIGATSQATAIEQISNSITNVSEKIEENAKNSNDAMDFFNNVTDEIKNCNGNMNIMLTAMNEINTSSENIAKIIKVIEDIAFQTNILALNAAVEAARAGQAGKGFAVVADEVRNLASKSAEAAKDTTKLIESSVQSVVAGVDISKNIAHALDDVVKKTIEVNDLIKNISNASNEQSSFIKSTVTQIEQVTEVIQSNSATSEEIAASSEELSSHATSMNEMVKIFKI